MNLLKIELKIYLEQATLPHQLYAVSQFESLITNKT